MKNLKITSKMALLSVFSILIFAVLIGWIYSHLKAYFYHDKEMVIHELVGASWETLDN